MARDERFTFLVDAHERRVLAALAAKLERSQGDVVRWLIRNAARELFDLSQLQPAQPVDGSDHAGR